MHRHYTSARHRLETSGRDGPLGEKAASLETATQWWGTWLQGCPPFGSRKSHWGTPHMCWCTKSQAASIGNKCKLATNLHQLLPKHSV